jgi:hypothetical protein
MQITGISRSVALGDFEATFILKTVDKVKSFDEKIETSEEHCDIVPLMDSDETNCLQVKEIAKMIFINTNQHGNKLDAKLKKQVNFNIIKTELYAGGAFL